jgi:hypothetical protein
MTFHSSSPLMLVLNQQGDLLHSFDTGLTEGHGIAAIREGRTDHVWIADCGTKSWLINGQQH